MNINHMPNTLDWNQILSDPGATATTFQMVRTVMSVGAEPIRPIEREPFEAWLFAQPKDRSFVFRDKFSCVLGRFLLETGWAKDWQIGTQPDYINNRSIIPLWLAVVIKNCTDHATGNIIIGQVQREYSRCNPDILKYVGENPQAANDPILTARHCYSESNTMAKIVMDEAISLSPPVSSF